MLDSPHITKDTKSGIHATFFVLPGIDSLYKVIHSCRQKDIVRQDHKSCFAMILNLRHEKRHHH